MAIAKEQFSICSMICSRMGAPLSNADGVSSTLTCEPKTMRQQSMRTLTCGSLIEYDTKQYGLSGIAVPPRASLYTKYGAIASPVVTHSPIHVVESATMETIEAFLRVFVFRAIQYARADLGWSWLEIILAVSGLLVIGAVIWFLAAIAWTIAVKPAGAVLYEEGIVGVGRRFYERLCRPILYGKKGK